MTPWVPDKKAEGGYTFIHHIVCKNCSYVIDEDGAIFEGGQYKCPNCVYDSRSIKTATKRTCVAIPGEPKRVVCIEETSIKKRKAL